uniref:NADH dehydrogenase subunit 5 n=1 Tax=Conlopa bredoni TaxID=3112144 RepID=UPI002E772F8D|nr:NADH dehydrogenase subunit 5 [Conlopa bredoni]WRK21434.1 NADH dehydrogenase subunit 5 [Conlopa bredoni]
MNLNFYFFWFFNLLIISVIFFYFGLYFLVNDYFFLFEWDFLLILSCSIKFMLVLDWVSFMFGSIVCFISCMVVIYSYQYMGGLSYSSLRFLFLVILFILSMLLMIFSPNMISIMIGWDGLGLVSYCLVIYYSSVKSYIAGMITCLTNRLGDIGLIISICWVSCYGSWYFMFYNWFYDSLIIYFFVFSCFTKSAQIPFSCWLPAAMAAPTPVSSLVHSSTLVTAGVYYVYRFFYDYLYMSSLFLFFSLLTMLMSSFCAIFEYDLKSIIAFSTLSQLGLMFCSIFLGNNDFCLFHLFSHALFKSLLFLCSGIFIYYMLDNQDIRLISSCSFMFPFTSVCFNISSFALVGFPFLSGFYSKDFILEYGLLNNNNFFFIFLFYLSVGFTAFYSFRLFYYTMLINSLNYTLIYLGEDLNFMTFSILFLSFFSVFFGCLLTWLLSLDMNLVILSIWYKVFPILMVFLGSYLSYELCFYSLSFSFFNFFNGSMWFLMGYFNYLYNFIYSFSFSLIFSVFWGEFYGALGVSYYLVKFSNFLQMIFIKSWIFIIFSFMFWLVIFF